VGTSGKALIVIGRKLKSVYRVIRNAWWEFYKDDGLNLAAGLAFFAILSTIPLALIVISVLGHVLGHQEELFRQISNWISLTVPGIQPEFLNFLRQLVDKKVSTGWIGLGFLFFVASLLFTNIEHILDKVLKTSKKRNFWHSRAFSILLLIITALLFFVPSQLNLLANHLPARGLWSQLARFFTGDVIYLISHAVIFFLLLEFVPNQSMPKRKILIGALVFAITTVFTRIIFRWYMGLAIERYAFIYGSLTVLVILILWIYYLALIFIFCAEIVSVLQGLYPEREGAGG
jgi:membrane protein